MPGYLRGAAVVADAGQHVRGAFVPADARRAVEILVTGEPDEHVGEPQRRRLSRVLGEQLGKQRLFQRGAHLGNVGRDDRAQYGTIEIVCEHRCGTDYGAAGRAQITEPMPDQPLDPVRHPKIGDGSLELLLVVQQPDHFAQEQRVPAGVATQLGCPRRIHLRIRAQPPRDVRHSETGQRQQVGLVGVARHRIPARPEQQQPALRHGSREMGEQPEGLLVGPVQVFQAQDQTVGARGGDQRSRDGVAPPERKRGR